MHIYITKLLKGFVVAWLFVLGLSLGTQAYAHEMIPFDTDKEVLVVPYDQMDGPIYWVNSTMVLHNDSCFLYVEGTGRFTRVPTGLNCNFCGGDGSGVTDLDDHPKEQPVTFELVEVKEPMSHGMMDDPS